MGQRIRLFLVLVLAALLTGGCWSRKELNEISIASAIGIDWKDNQYLLSVQVVNPGSITKRQGDQTTPFIVYSAKGVTLNEAVRRLTSSISRKIFFSHIRIAVMSEEVAQQGIAKPVDFLMRGNEIRSDFVVVIAKGNTAKEVLGVTTPLEKISANFIFNALEVADREWSAVAAIKLDELSTLLLGEGMNPVLSGVYIAGNPDEGKLGGNVQSSIPPVRIQHAGIAVFRKDKLVGWMNERESRGYTKLTDRTHRSSTHLACPEGGVVGVDAAHVKTVMKGKVEDGKASVQVDFTAKGAVSSVACAIDLNDSSVIDSLNKEYEQHIKGYMELAIQKAKRLGTDIFGFGAELHRTDPNYWNKVKYNWDETFKTLQVDVRVKVNITGTGTIVQSPVQTEEGKP